MPSVEVSIILIIQISYDTYSQGQAQTDYIDEDVQNVSAQVPEGDNQVIFKHAIP